MDSY
jgi:hypothetical protein